jgi:hypothetical protein
MTGFKALIAHQTQIGLVKERRGIKRVTGLLSGHLCRCQPPPLIVGHRRKLLRGLEAALLDRTQDAGNLVPRRLGPVRFTSSAV